MKEVKAIIKSHRLEHVLELLHEHPGLPGVTISHVQGFGRKVGRTGAETGEPVHYGMVNLVKIECVVDDAMLDEVLQVIGNAARTGNPGDGKVFIYNVEELMTISDGSRSNYIK